MSNYVTYANAAAIMEKIGQKFDALGGVYIPKGSRAFANLPSPHSDIVGWVYNVTDAFTTTNKFLAGAGKSYPAGTNVVVVDTTEITYTIATEEELAEITNPSESSLYELVSAEIYVPTTDTTVDSEKVYYHKTVMAQPAASRYKYDILMGTVSEPDGLDSNQMETLISYLD